VHHFCADAYKLAPMKTLRKMYLALTLGGIYRECMLDELANIDASKPIALRG
jgi:hypothetical protein